MQLPSDQLQQISSEIIKCLTTRPGISEQELFTIFAHVPPFTLEKVIVHLQESNQLTRDLRVIYK